MDEEFLDSLFGQVERRLSFLRKLIDTDSPRVRGSNNNHSVHSSLSHPLPFSHLLKISTAFTDLQESYLLCSKIHQSIQSTQTSLVLFYKKTKESSLSVKDQSLLEQYKAGLEGDISNRLDSLSHVRSQITIIATSLDIPLSSITSSSPPNENQSQNHHNLTLKTIAITPNKPQTRSSTRQRSPSESPSPSPSLAMIIQQWTSFKQDHTGSLERVQAWLTPKRARRISLSLSMSDNISNSGGIAHSDGQGSAHTSPISPLKRSLRITTVESPVANKSTSPRNANGIQFLVAMGLTNLNQRDETSSLGCLTSTIDGWSDGDGDGDVDTDRESIFGGGARSCIDEKEDEEEMGNQTICSVEAVRGTECGLFSLSPTLI